MKTFLHLVASLSICCFVTHSQAQNAVNHFKKSFKRDSLHGHFRTNHSNQFTNARIDKASKQKLDSIVSKTYKSFSIYDKNGNVIVNTDYDFDSIQNKWVKYSETKNTFDHKNRKLTQLFYYKDGSSEVLNLDSRTDYDTLGNYIFYANYDKSGDSSANKYENIYNIKNQLVSYKYYYLYIDKKWKLSSKYDHTYDINENLESVVYYTYNQYDSTYSTSSKEVYSYNQAGKEVTQKNYNYNKIDKTWLLSRLDTSVYDNNGYLRSITTLNNSYSDSLEYQRKYELNVDNKGNIISDISYYYDDSLNTWEEQGKGEYSYDLSVLATDVFGFELWESNNKVVSGKTYDWNSQTNTWEKPENYTLYYSNFTPAGIEKINLVQGNAFPNPFKTGVSWQLVKENQNAELTIINLQGEQVFSKNIENNETTPLENLKSGIYFYQILQGEQLYQGKLIKE